MSGYLDALLLATAIVATGWVALDLLGVREPSAFLRAAFSIAVGLILTMLALYLPLAIVDRVEFVPALVMLGAGTVVALIRCGLRLRTARPALPGLHSLVLLVAIGGPIAAASLVPYRGYDARAIFGLKAKVLLYERGVHGPLFQDVDLVHYHSDYPLGVPLLAAFAGWTAEGEPEDPEGLQPADSAEEWIGRHDAINAYMVLALLWIVGVAAAVTGLVRRRVQQPLLSAGLVALALPVVLVLPNASNAGWLSVAAGDRPLMLCLGVAGLALMRWLDDGQRGWLALAGLGAAGAVLLKNEALLAVGTLTVAGFTAGRRRRSLSGGLSLVAGLLAAMGLVLAVRSRIPAAPYDEQYLASLSLDRIPIWIQRVPSLFEAIGASLVSEGTEILWLAFTLFAVPFAWRAGGGARVLMTWVVLNHLLCSAVMLATPNHLVWHVDTALNRLWFHLTIPAAALVVDGVLALWSRAETND